MATIDKLLSEMAEVAGSIGPFKAEPIYEPVTDSLMYYARSGQTYSKRLNPLLTVYLSTDDDTLMGCEVKGIRRILSRIENLRKRKMLVLVSDEKLLLGLFIELALVPGPDDEDNAQYEEKIEEFFDVPVNEGELVPCG